MSNYKLSLDYLLKCYKMQQNIYGSNKNNSEIAKSLNNLALVY